MVGVGLGQGYVLDRVFAKFQRYNWRGVRLLALQVVKVKVMEGALEISRK